MQFPSSLLGRTMTGTDRTFVMERGLRRGRIVALSYLNFDLLIERVGEGYRAQVTASPAGEGTHDFELPFSDKDLEIFVLRVIGLGTRANVRSIEAPEMQYVKQFGGRLFETVFSGAVRDCLIGSIAESEDQEAGLRLRLRLGT